ncbi:MAG: helix-turn-helix transcriptional regulator [Bacteroidota bacterium]
MNTELPIGKIIKQVLDRSGMKLKVFAARIGTTRQNVYKIFDRQSISTDRLQKISQVLEYDFFKHFALDPKERSTSENLLAGGKARYADLQAEIESLRERIQILEDRIADKDEIIALLKAQAR